MSKRTKVQLHKERALSTKRKLPSWKYEATITCNERTCGENIYIGIAETTFKKRYSNHKRSFNLPAYKNDTELSKEFWKIKRRNSVPQIKWRIMKKCSPFHRPSLRCNFCPNKKLEIALFKGNNILNRRTASFKMQTHKQTHLRQDTRD